MRKSILITLFAIGLAGTTLAWWMQRTSGQGEAISMSAILATDTTGYARVMGPRPFIFPEDHGPHPAYRLEWWYYTGNLADAAGRTFGYQFTIFRNALAPLSEDAERTSDWATNQLYLAHFTLSDVQGNAFHAFERFSRGAAGLAGAQASPFKVWVEDWQVREAGDGMPVMNLEAKEEGVRLALRLEPAKPMVLQGEEGYSVKGPGAAA